MKILLWNVYNGFQDGSKTELLPSQTRRAFAYEWIRTQDVDAVGLLELQAFRESDFGSLFRGWGHANGQFLKGAYPMGLSSRIPMGNPIRHNIEMVHGLIAVEQGPITLVLTHIPPKAYSDRSKELRTLLDTILPMMKRNRPIILMGDFNAQIDAPLPTALSAIGLVPLLNHSQKDHVFVSSDIAGRVQSTIEWSPELEKISDHFPVHIVFR